MLTSQLPSLSLCEVMVFGIPKQLVTDVVASSKLRCASLYARNTECSVFSYKEIFESNRGLCKMDKISNVSVAAPIVRILFENLHIEGDNVYISKV